MLTDMFHVKPPICDKWMGGIFMQIERHFFAQCGRQGEQTVHIKAKRVK